MSTDWGALSDLSNKIKSGDFSEAGTLSKFGKVLKGTSKFLTVAGSVITVGIDLADACYDERTKSLSVGNIDGSDLAADIAVDAAVIAIPIVAPALADLATCALIGSVVPGVGTVVGLAVGAVILGLSVWEYGEPPKTAIDNVKDWAEDTTEDIGQWFAKVFW